MSNQVLFSGAMAVFENQGELYTLTTQIVSTCNQMGSTTNLLSLFVLNGTKLIQVQELSVKPFVSNRNSPAGNDFIAVTGSFHKKLK